MTVGEFMRVAVVSHYYPPHCGGIEQVAHDQAHFLTSAGCAVRVITTDAPRSGDRHQIDSNPGIYRLQASNLIETGLGIPYPLVNPSEWSTVRRALAGAEIAIIHDVFYQTSTMAALACRLAGIPYIVCQHVNVVAHPNPAVIAAQHAVFRTSGAAILAGAQQVWTFSQAVRRFVEGLGVPNTKMRHTSQGIDTSQYQPLSQCAKLAARRDLGLPHDGPLVAFVGRLVAKKGHALLAQAAAPKQYTIAIAGGGDIPAQGPAGVHYLGRLDQAAARKLMQCADVFCFPAISEAFPLSVQEAMACGAAMVLGADHRYDDEGLHGDLVRFVDRDAAAIRGALTELVANPQQLHAMAQYSRDFATARFDADVAHHDQLGFLHEVIGRVASRGPGTASGAPATNVSASGRSAVR